MPRIMRRPAPANMPMFGPQPQPQPISTNWRDTLYNYGQQYGPHILPGLLSGLGGAAQAYQTQKSLYPSQIPPIPQPSPTAGTDVQQQTETVQPESMLPQNAPSNPQANMFDLLSQLIAHRTDIMGMGMPTYPDRLFSQAVQASNSQLGSPQGPPQYTPTGPQFAFDQLIGGGAQYNPLSALGDYSQPQQAQKSWLRTGANQVGGLLSSLAPLAGSYGGLPGILGGAALGATGYGLRQL